MEHPIAGLIFATLWPFIIGVAMAKRYAWAPFIARSFFMDAAMSIGLSVSVWMPAALWMTTMDTTPAFRLVYLSVLLAFAVLGMFTARRWRNWAWTLGVQMWIDGYIKPLASKTRGNLK